MNMGPTTVWSRLRFGKVALGFASFLAGFCFLQPDARAAGAVVAWGNSGYGETNLPGGLTAVVALDAAAHAGRHSLALKNDGTVVAWGSDTPALPGGLTEVAMVSAGYAHCLALRSNGTVAAWGDNSGGALNVPGGLSGVVEVAAGFDHSLALKADGTMVAWGNNTYRACDVPANLAGVASIAANTHYSMALMSNGTVVTWGIAPTPPVWLTNVVAIAAGYQHGMALLSNGTVVAWGVNTAGQTNVLAGLSGIVGISAGTYHSMALKADGTAVAWGYNDVGQTNVPAGLSGVSSIAAGYQHNLALKPYGPTVTTSRFLPPGLLSAAYNQTLQATGGTAPYSWRILTGHLPAGLSLSSGGVISGTPLAAGLACFRARVTGADGLATERDFSLVVETGAVQVNLSPAGAVALGAQWRVDGGAWFGNGATVSGLSAGNHTVSFNTVTNWVAPTNLAVNVINGQTLVTNGAYTPNPALQFAGLNAFLPSARLGGSYSQTLQGSGGTGSYTWSWSGSTPPGLSLGAGGLLSGTPTRAGTYGFTVTLSDGVNTIQQPALLVIQPAQIAAGYQHTLARRWNGAVWSWGRNLYGQLGNGTTNSTLTVIQASGSDGMSAVAAGYDHTLALKSDGTVWAWGWNYHGQLGNGTTNSTSTAVQVSGINNVIAIAAGAYQSIALKSDGTVWMWGYNADGELGDGTTTNRSTPVQVSGLSGVVAIAGGAWHALALKSDGTIRAWGLNFYSQLGDGTATERHTPVPVAGLSGVTALAAGWGHSVALKSDGTIWGWGFNGDGQLGDGTTSNRTAPVQVSGLSGATAIAAGYRHTLALKSDGTVWAWGFNLNGQLGNGGNSNRSTPSQTIGLSGMVAIAAGWDHNVALKSDGTVWGWGYNAAGAVGDGTTSERSIPVQIAGFNLLPNGSLQVTLDPAGAVTAGAQWRVDGNAWQNSGAIVTNLLPGLHAIGFKTVSGWRAPTNQSINVASLVTTVTNGTYALRINLEFSDLGSALPTVMLGGTFNQALQATGGSGGYLWSWSGSTPPGLGLSAGGVLSGTPTTAGVYNFTVTVTDGVETINQAVTMVIQSGLIATGYQHTLALKFNGGVWGWGRNAYGQLGNGATNTALAAVQASALDGVIALAAGYDHTLALKPNGTVWSWGWNAYGQLGDGATTSRSTPAQIASLSGIVAIAAGAYQSIALKSDGTVWMWGYNADGELGDGTTTSRSTPVQVSGLSDVIAIAGGLWHALALKSDGTIWTWGLNFYGQLGDGTTTTRLTPVQAAALGNVAALAAGWGHSVALKNDGTVWGWGYNADGQLGDGTTANRAAPVQASGLSGAKAVAAGYRHTLALKNDGTVWGWGWSAHGQLGNGATASRSTPSQVSGLSGVIAIAAGWNHSAALKSDGYVWGWGDNISGALGDGTAAERTSPVLALQFNRLPDGSLQVLINPALVLPAGAQWRVDGAAWQNSGVTITNLFPGPHTVGFKPVAGWIVPSNLNITVTSFLTTATNATYQTAEAGRAQIITPTNGTTLATASVTFNWDRGINASQFALWLGSTPIGHDLAAVAVGTNLSRTLTVPANGRPLYLRLWSQINGNWYAHDYTYTAPSPVPAAMLSPVNGSTNSGPSMTFIWDSGAGVSQYALWVGSASNSYDLHAVNAGTNLTRTLSMPVDGRAIFVRLWSLVSGAWLSNDYAYRAFNAIKARLTGLANGVTFGSANVTLNWDAGTGVSQYALWIGSTPGSYDLYALLMNTNRTHTLALPSDGRQIYITLWSLINGSWKQNNYNFTAHTAPSSRAAMITPTNGAVFVSNPVTLNWSAGTGVTQYALWIGNAPASHGLLAEFMGTNRTYQLALPLDGDPIHVRLWSQLGGTWQWNDYAYGTTAPGGAAKAVMTSPAYGTVLTAASTLFTWSAGTGVSQYALWAGSAPGTYDLYAATVGTNRTRTVTLPADGASVYVRLWSLMSGTWRFNDYFYTAYAAP